jgi:DNA-nicking Smr family endonuclease
MDFGDILDEWDRIKNEGEESPAPRNGSDEKDPREPAGEDRSREARRLAALKPQAVLDLHGLTAEAAESAIAAFIEGSAREGLEKVLVIHGKGLHSEGGQSVLKKTARRVLEAHPLAGRIGEASRFDGGSGALWVLIRNRRH